MGWRWTDEPPSLLRGAIGTRLSLRLPLAIEGEAPLVSWETSRLRDLPCHVDPACPWAVVVDLRAASAGFYRLLYKIEDDEGRYLGLIEIEVPPLARTQASLAHTQSSPLPSISSALKAQAPSWSLRVSWQGKFFQHYHVALPKHRVITVGRFSSSLTTRLDLDLSGAFGSPEEEQRLSRLQAEIFWQDDRLLIRNVGKHPLLLGKGSLSPMTSLETGQTVPWSPEEIVILPGDLSLHLIDGENAG